MEKPVTFEDVFCAALFIGLGQVVLIFLVPNFYMLLAREIAGPGPAFSANDFPLDTLQPAVQWLLDTVGAIGPSFVLAAVGAGLIIFGWQRFLSDKFD